MIRHPYFLDGEFQIDAHAAAMDRALYYGTAGLLDPRTYTVEPWMLRKAGMSWRGAFLTSVRLASWTVALSASLGYLGYDPMNVTPGYGLTIDLDSSYDRFGEPIDMYERPSRYLMM